MQVLGGHGYIKEWGLEQYVRDVRIAQIYVGTNGIQALDLMGRKVLKDGGAKLRLFGGIVEAFIKENADNEQMQEFIGPLAALGKEVQDGTMKIGMKAMSNPDEAGAAATDYLRVLGHLVYGYFWARMAKVALENDQNDAFYKAKLQTARFYYQRLMPETNTLLQTMVSGSDVLLDMDVDAF